MKQTIMEKLAKLRQRIGRKTETKPVLLVYVLDESGSMLPVRTATISGYDEFLSTLKRNEKASAQLMTLITFNVDWVVGDTSKFRFKNKPLTEVPSLQYNPAGGTPLYDAVMDGISEAKKYKDTHDILFVIHTDGEENSSKRFTRSQIFNEINVRTKEGWVFTFLGASQEAYQEAINIGILAGNTARYSNTIVGTRSTFKNMAANIGTYHYGMTTDDREENADKLVSGNTGEVADWRDETDGTSSNPTK